MRGQIIEKKKIDNNNLGLGSDLRQAIKVVNADYQLLDWEDQEFLSRVLRAALANLETNEEAKNNGTN
ncbi:MAG TPA: hypothetical protein VF599_04175 [Pyrinomonadaceae bacterium]|jgi:hypothetical protein